MIDLVLVRHGEPDWEPGGRAVDDPGLTSRGREQARLTAAALANMAPFDAVYVSPLRRALETAEPIGPELGMEPQALSWLAELGPPSMEGQTEEEVRRFFEQAWLRDLEKWWDGMPGGESFRHFYERVSAGVESLLVGEHPLELHENSGYRVWRVDEARRLLIVAHQGTNAVILSHLLGVDPVPWAWVRFASQWCGISRIHTASVAGSAVWVLESFNRIEHLGPLRVEMSRP